MQLLLVLADANMHRSGAARLCSPLYCCYLSCKPNTLTDDQPCIQAPLEQLPLQDLPALRALYQAHLQDHLVAQVDHQQ